MLLQTLVRSGIWVYNKLIVVITKCQGIVNQYVDIDADPDQNAQVLSDQSGQQPAQKMCGIGEEGTWVR